MDIKLINNEKGFIQCLIILLIIVFIIIGISSSLWKGCSGFGTGKLSSKKEKAALAVPVQKKQEQYLVIKIIGDKVFINGTECGDYENSINNITDDEEVRIFYSENAKAYIVDNVLSLVKQKGLIIAKREKI